MRHCFTYIPFSKSACRKAATFSFCAILLSGVAPVAQAQTASGYGNVPPPPLSASSPYGRSTRGTYMLPGTRNLPSGSRLPAPPRSSLYEEKPLPPVSLSGDAPPPPRMAPLPTRATETAISPNYRAETPSTLRYATPPMPRNQVYYPKPIPVQPVAIPQPVPQPLPQIEPQTPVVATPLPPQEQPVLVAPPVIIPVPVPMTEPVEAVVQPPVEMPPVEMPPIELPAPETPALAVETPVYEPLETLPEFATPLPEEPPVPASEVPVTQAVEISQVPVAEAPVLSVESREILGKTPSGIDSKVVARTPDPVIIKRTSPTAGNIPSVDVRTHEEMGLKIEIRQADINVHSYLEKGYENLIAGHEAIAAGYYSEALDAEPENEMALFGLATTYQRMGKADEARELYGRLLAINPTHREALNNFMALISDEAPQDAITELEKLETENPDFSPIPAQLGIIYRKLGDNTMAVNKLLRALELSPDNISYKYHLATTLDAMGKRQDAADLYMELIEDYNNGATLPGDIVTIRNRAIFLNSKS